MKKLLVNKISNNSDIEKICLMFENFCFLCINCQKRGIMRLVPKKKEILILPFLIPCPLPWCGGRGIFYSLLPAPKITGSAPPQPRHKKNSEFLRIRFLPVPFPERRSGSFPLHVHNRLHRSETASHRFH